MILTRLDRACDDRDRARENGKIEEATHDKNHVGGSTGPRALARWAVHLSTGWGPLPAGAQTVREVFEKVSPSVAVIRARGRDVTASGQTRFSETGSGVLISADGKVMTAAHVVHAMDEISVEFLGGDAVAAHVVSSEPAADLSMLQLDRVRRARRWPRWPTPTRMHVGDQVIIVGAPYGPSYSLSVGYISARWPPNSVYKTMPLAEFFQTDATINTGNSGGPMFNMKGEVIGIVSHNISKGGGSEGLGFVVTLNTAKQLLLEKRSFWSGLEGIVLQRHLADLLNLPGPGERLHRQDGGEGLAGGRDRAAGEPPSREHQRAGGPPGRRYHPVGRGRSGGRRQSGQDPGRDERAACRRALQGERSPRGPGARADRQGTVTRCRWGGSPGEGDPVSRALVVAICIATPLLAGSAGPAAADVAGARDVAPFSFFDEAAAFAGPDRAFLTGDWGGLRTRLLDLGIALNLAFVTDVLGNPAGGRRQAVRESDELALRITADLDRLAGWAGARFYLLHFLCVRARISPTRTSAMSSPWPRSAAATRTGW